ncbi:hypothetical protein HDU67_005273 [Dinochytrium kinnereticum]|nr:hypothetical protein HDU67_005273 [Dinochytrium kinnereticum]
MASSRVSPIVRFLTHAKALSRTQQASGITVVIGNEAADLDSVVSAISYAFLKHSTTQSETNARSYIPVIHVPRKDFAIRTDCTFALTRAFPSTDNGDVTSQLTFIDEIDLDAISSSCDLKFILTDHNRLAPSLSRFSHLVHGILDHHRDEGLYPDVSPRVIEPVGSATSLVALEWKQSETGSEVMDGSLATLMLSPIMLDTINLDPKFGRCTDKDIEATQYLLPLANASEVERATFRKDLFDQLQAAKFDCSSLSNEDLLKKDYKEVAVPHGISTIKFGISSVTWFLDAWIEKESGTLDSILSSLRSFSVEQHLDIALVMLAFNHPEPVGFRRELLVYVCDGFRQKEPQLADAFVTNLEDERFGLGLKMDGVAGGGEPERVLKRYHQGNGKMSRKMLLPIVEQIVAEFGASEVSVKI